MEEEDKDMGIEKEMEYTFIISKGLVILIKIATLNCVIWKINCVKTIKGKASTSRDIGRSKEGSHGRGRKRYGYRERNGVHFYY
jgi:hypothetical protein